MSKKTAQAAKLHLGRDLKWTFLPHEQLTEVLLAPKEQARDLFIAGIASHANRTLHLMRGDLSRLAVPFSIFGASGTAEPDFRRLEIDDYGHTIRFGDYEAATDFVLYTLDPDYRRRSNAKRLGLKGGFGSSLRRLRILRRLGRDGFGEVPARTIAKIEKGEMRARGKTLRVICETLEVEAGEIRTY